MADLIGSATADWKWTLKYCCFCGRFGSLYSMNANISSISNSKMHYFIQISFFFVLIQIQNFKVSLYYFVLKTCLKLLQILFVTEKKRRKKIFWPALSGRRKVLMSPRFRLCDEVMFLSYFFFRWILFENFSYINILGSINFYFWNFWKRKCLDLSMQWIFPLSFASQCRCLCAWRRSPTIMLKKWKNYYKTPQTSKTPKYNFSCVV